MNPAKITLDDPVFAGRVRYVRRGSNYVRRPMSSQVRTVNDIFFQPAPVKPVALKNEFPQQQVEVQSQPEKPQSINLTRYAAPEPKATTTTKRRPKQLYALYSMAAAVFVLGLAVSFRGWQANHQVAAQVEKLQKPVASRSSTSGSNSGSTPPTTTKPQASALASYTVPSDQPRYIDIPSLGAHARVLKVGVNKAGEIGTPESVFDTAWYSGSAKPGQNGAMLIDGHVSSWTTHGVFYGLKDLKPGAIIKVQRGDGKTFQYKVVKSQAYPADKVDMNAALAPVNQGTPGLNLITCTGQVKPGTSEFNQRVVVFSEQI